MESTRFGYSTKNIPLPSEKDYNRKLIDKTEHLCTRMRWKAYFFLNPDAKGNQKETFAFNSKNTPPQIPAMSNFERRLPRLLNTIENIKFRKVKCWFQQKLLSDIETNIKTIPYVASSTPPNLRLEKSANKSLTE